MEKLLTIVVPSYNVERYLNDILKTYLIPEAFPLFEVLIVNDGSKDRTKEIAEGFCRDYPACFRLINKENGGHGSTINTGIQHARGKYLRVIDGDDWVDSRCLRNYLEKLKGLDADLVLSPFRYVSDSGVPLREQPMPDTVRECEVLPAPEHIEAIQALYMMHAVAVRLDILRQIPPISEHCFYVDNEFINFPLPYVKTVVFINECVYQYRYGTQEQSVSLQNTLKNRSHFRTVFTRLAGYEPRCRDAAMYPLVRRHVLSMCSRNLELYLFLPPSREHFEELQQFIADVKSAYPWILPEIRYWKYRRLLKSSYAEYWLLAMYTKLRLKRYGAQT